jgi:threonine dehydratase
MAHKRMDDGRIADDTFDEGMGTRVLPAKLTMAIMRDLTDDALLISDDDMRRRVLHLISGMRIPWQRDRRGGVASCGTQV